MSPPRRLKAPIRALAGRFGYEIVPRRHTESEFVAQLMTASSTDLVIDIGANQGQYALKLRAIGYLGRIESFEPQRAACALLEHYSRHDSLWNAHRIALGDEVGLIDLYVSRNSVSSSLLKVTDRHVEAAPTSSISGREKVSVERLDDYLRVGDQGARSIWLKLDVQGFELSVLEGAPAWLEASKVVQCELSLDTLYHGQSTYLQVIDHLSQYGFRLRRVDSAFEDFASGATLQLDGTFVKDGD